MKVWSDPQQWLKDWSSMASSCPGGVCLTIGNFDGVHVGHQELLKKIVDQASQSQGFSLLLTFQPHPVQILAPEKKHTRLFDLQDQQDELQKSGLQGLLRQPFSRQFSEVSAGDFLEDYLLKYFHPQLLVVGHDFSFGAHRLGTHELLREFCRLRKIHLEIVPAFRVDGEVVSTTRIREHLQNGELLPAEKMLGRKYEFKGIVEKGEARGRLLGFPTANIRPDVDFYPKMGVYACEVFVGAKKHSAVMNVGRNRTFVEGDHHPIKVEVHLLDFQGDLYGRTLKVRPTHYLREERKFPSLEDLKKQIAKDIESAQGLMK